MARKLREPTDHVTCQHCQREFRAITSSHLQNIHSYDGDHSIHNYKTAFDLPSAVCRDTLTKMSAARADFWDKRGQHWTRETVITEILRIHHAGESLKCERVPNRTYLAASRLFGTWKSAIKKAGLNYDEVMGIQRWTRQRVIERIQELAAANVPLNATYIEAHYPQFHLIAVKKFPKSWSKALRAAGFDPDEHKVPRGSWNPQTAEEWVRKRFVDGLSLRAGDAPRDLLGFVHKRLKMGWADFVESLGFRYPGIKKRRDWTKRTLLAEIRRWQAEGHRMNYHAVKVSYQALIHQARKYYGTWDKACEAAKRKKPSPKPV